MNVLQDFSKVPTPMPMEGEVEADEEQGGKNEEKGKENKKAPTGKDALGDKGKLKAWFSS